MRSRTRLTVSLVVCAVLAVFVTHNTASTNPQAPWVPPVGIPTPTFGIAQAARARPLQWFNAERGYYYVDATAPTATDSSNTYGTPARPRRTIPSLLPAGAVVELHGTYGVAHTSPRGIVSRGTAQAPVFIRGTSATRRPTVAGCWEVAGAYFILENLEFTGCSSVIFTGRTHHAALRHSEVHGNPAGGGVGVVSWDDEPLNDVVIYDNRIHDNGDVNASYDQDVHGIAVGHHVSRLWVVDNHLYRNSGDGIQINAGSAARQATTHHIYVGRNVAHHNKQSGFWSKQAVDVIFSQNQSYSHRPGNSSLGACMGGQYAPDHVWFINNSMWDCDYGIQLASDSGAGTGRLQFFIGNIITRINDSDGGFEPLSAWQDCAISLPGGTYRYVVENSIYDVASAVCMPGYGWGRFYLYDNLIQRVSQGGRHLMFDSRATLSALASGSNLFAPDYRLGVGPEHAFSNTVETVVRGENNLVADVGWVDPMGGNFSLTPDSPARDNGVMNALGIWQYFEQRYGEILSRDYNGASRTWGVPDCGATESGPQN